MVVRPSVWTALGLCIAIGACAPMVQNKENMLAAAGFTLLPASTPQRQASLASLPPHKFVHQVRNGKIVYLYADPTICDCLYVGDQAAYGRYQQNVFRKNLADEHLMTAEMNQDFDSGIWGPGLFY